MSDDRRAIGNLGSLFCHIQEAEFEANLYMILLKMGELVRHTWVSGDIQTYEAGIICKCGFTNWFYFLAVFNEVFKITYLITKHPSKIY